MGIDERPAGGIGVEVMPELDLGPRDMVSAHGVLRIGGDEPVLGALENGGKAPALQAHTGKEGMPPGAESSGAIEQPGQPVVREVRGVDGVPPGESEAVALAQDMVEVEVQPLLPRRPAAESAAESELEIRREAGLEGGGKDGTGPGIRREGGDFPGAAGGR